MHAKDLKKSLVKNPSFVLFWCDNMKVVSLWMWMMMSLLSFLLFNKRGAGGCAKKAEFMTHFIWRWFKFFAFARTHMYAHWNKSWAAQRAVNFAYISHNRYLSFVCTPSTKSREQMSQLQIQLCIKRWSWICADFFYLLALTTLLSTCALAWALN